MKKRLSTLVVGIFLIIMLAALVLPACAKQQAAVQPVPTPVPAKAQYEWNAATVNAETAAYSQALRVFCDLVQKRTDGRVVITPYFGGALGGERETFEALKLNNINITSQCIYGAYGDERFDLTNYPRVSTSIINMAEMAVPQDSEINQLFKKWLAADHGIYMMSMHAGPTRDVILVNKEATRLTDLKGLKIRIPETPLWLDFFKRIGVVATPIAYTEVYTSLQRNVIDGYESTLSGPIQIKAAEVVKYIFRTGHCGQTYEQMINKKLWDTLPQDIRDILERSAQQAVRFQTAASYLEEMDSYKLLQTKYGIKLINPTPEDVKLLDKTALDMLADWQDRLKPEATAIIRKILEAKTK